jgi:hypothetical protein
MFQIHQMSRHRPRRRSGAGDTLWLSMLVERFEKLSQADLRAVPCEERALLAVKAQLAGPALHRDAVADQTTECSIEPGRSSSEPSQTDHSQTDHSPAS